MAAGKHDTAALCVLCCLWGQARVLRGAIYACYSGKSLVGLCRASPPHAADYALAMLAVAAPSLPTLVLSAGATLWSDWRLAPLSLDNGGTFELHTAFLLLVGLLGALYAGEPGSAGLAASAPFVRFNFVWIYVFAAVAKLNVDFFNPRRSSNTVFVVLILGGAGVSPDALSDASWLAAFRAGLLGLEVVEFGIPLLFYLGWVRSGVALNWAFHLALGVVAFDFSTATTVTLPLLWLPLLGRGSEPLLWESHFGCFTTHPVARLVWVLVAVQLLRVQKAGDAVGSPVHGAWLVWAVLLACGLGSACWAASDDDLPWLQEAPAEGDGGLPPPPLGASTAAAWCVAALGWASMGVFMLTGLAPYLGLKTHATYSMFSNLRVEGGVTNHLFYRPWMAVFPFLHDLVTVTRTNLPSVQSYMTQLGGPAGCGSLRPLVERLKIDAVICSNGVLEKGKEGEEGRTKVIFPYRVPFIQLRYLVSEERDAATFFVEYTQAGQRKRFELRKGGALGPGSDPQLRRRLPTVLFRKWLFCRAMQVEDRDCGVCYH